jgi:hypothetical protein
MLAFRQRFFHRRMGAWQILFCLTLLSLLYRAVVPIGYMPNAVDHDGGKLSITLCTTSGDTSTIWIEVDDESTSSSTDGHTNHLDCPFGILIAQAELPDQDPVSMPGKITLGSMTIPTPRNQARPPLPALGPPLGSRAPPVHLG